MSLFELIPDMTKELLTHAESRIGSETDHSEKTQKESHFVRLRDRFSRFYCLSYLS